LLTGETALGALALSVEPSGAAGDSMSPVALFGDTGESFCFEQAMAAARTAAQVQSMNLFWNINNLSSLWIVGPLGWGSLRN
jgi:hypothetical protein